MSADYQIEIGPAEFFICTHPLPHKGPCTPSTFLTAPTCSLDATPDHGKA